MVVADAADGCEQRIRLAARLAKDFDAVLLGVASETISGNFYAAIGEAYGATARLLEDQEALVREDLRTAEGHFRTATRELVQEVQWVSTEGPTFATINDAACRADIVVSARRAGDTFGTHRGEGAADLLLLTGRPVVVAPPGLEQLRDDTVMVAWKDTREARRAVADALPLLHRARRVVLGSTADNGSQGRNGDALGRISGYLASHGIAAEIQPVPADSSDIGARLVSAAEQAGAGLVVAGAYGHSRVREWAWGGVSEHLIRHCPLATLMSH